MGTKEIEVMESLYLKNAEMSDEINKYLTDIGVFATNVMGAPGAGKTSTLIQLIPMLRGSSFVIEGDIESDIDTQKLKSLGIQTVQINTGGACHLDSPLIYTASKDLNLSQGYLFIENIGNLVCPAEFLIGEHIKLLISSITEGSDKPYKYPLAFEKADIILINKYDLLEYVDFDEDYFRAGVRKLNPISPIFNVSGKTGYGFKEVAAWIAEKSKHVIKK